MCVCVCECTGLLLGEVDAFFSYVFIVDKFSVSKVPPFHNANRASFFFSIIIIIVSSTCKELFLFSLVQIFPHFVGVLLMECV